MTPYYPPYTSRAKDKTPKNQITTISADMAENNNTQLLIISDSQTRGLQDGSGITIHTHSGATIGQARKKTEKREVDGYKNIAIWVGGNNAYPKEGQFNSATMTDDLTGLIDDLKKRTTAQIILVTATRRWKDPAQNIPKVNEVIAKVARDRQVLMANAYRKLERMHFDYLDRDGTHLTDKGKEVVVDHIRATLKTTPRNDDRMRSQGNNWLKRRRRTDLTKPIYVSGPHSRLSNFWIEDFRLDNIPYSSGEQAYQHKKATKLGQTIIAAMIMKTKCPYQIKAKGNELNDLNNGTFTNKDRKDTAFAIIRARARQNPRFLQTLRETGQRQIIHNVFDKYWGQWYGQGQNVFGQLLMTVRDNE